MALCHPHSQPPIAHLLQTLPSLQQVVHNHSEVVATLRALILDQSHLVHYHINTLGQYLLNNLQNNASILLSLQCLVLLHPQLSNPFKRQATSTLQAKYQCTNFTLEVDKLRAVNLQLVEPFICLLGRLAEWFQLQIEDKEYKEVSIAQPTFLLEYAYSLSRLEFESGLCLEEGNIDYCMLMIYRLLTEDHSLLAEFLKDPCLPRQLALTIFYFLGNYSLENQQHVYAIFHAISKLLSLLLFQNVPFKQTVLEELLPQLRTWGLRPSNEHGFVIQRIQSAVTAILAIKWSSEAESEWTGFCWLLWDLLQVQPAKMVQMTSELLVNAKDLSKYLELS